LPINIINLLKAMALTSIELEEPFRLPMAVQERLIPEKKVTFPELITFRMSLPPSQLSLIEKKTVGFYRSHLLLRMKLSLPN